MGADNNNNPVSGNNETTTKVDIRLYATGLKNVAGTLKGVSDPYAVVTVLAGSPNEKPRVLGKTEVIKNSLKPDWITQFTTSYQFGRETRINIGIFDEVRKTGKHKTMGSAQFELGEILGSRGNVKAKHLRNGGTIFCRVTKSAGEDYGTLQLQLRGEDLKIDGGGLFGKGKPDPFFVLNAQAAHTGGNRVWHQEFRSEVVKGVANPEWKPFELSMDRICGGDRDRAVQFEGYSWEKSGKHKSLGKFQTSVFGLLAAAAAPDRGLDLVQKGKPCGKVFVTQGRVNGGEQSSSSTSYTALTFSAPPQMMTPVALPAMTVSDMTASLPQVSSEAQESAPTLPLPMIPSSSEFPISASDSASSLPPAMPPPAFDVSDGPEYRSSTESLSAVEDNSNQSKQIPQPSAPPRIPSNRKPQFVDYLSGGLQIQLSVAIDFTGSNGDPRMPGTLHHIHSNGQLNDYEKALTAVGSVVAKYDKDQRFPVYGFGAKYGGVIQHCFQVGGSAELEGLKGVLKGYRSVFSTGLTMSGPTVFAEVIQHAAVQAQREYERKQANGEQSYSILLILTDGAVTNEKQTKVALKYASTAPLSIVIVGVGSDDFTKMKFLDQVHRSESGMRDIVKFVEFNKFRHDRQALTSETLAEIPHQVVEFYHEKGIKPLPPTTDSQLDIFAEAYDSKNDLELDFRIGEDGAMHLADSRQAIWNAHSYDSAGAYLSSTSGSSSQPSMNLQSGYTTSSMTSNAFTSFSPGREKPKMSSYVSTTSASPHGSTTAAASETIVSVKVPENGYPGMQLRVLNPRNGKEKVVAVPPGVPPGGTFPCSV